MMKHNEELLSAYLDGELTAAQSSALEQRLAIEPALRSELDSMRQIDATLQRTFNTARARTVPARILQLLSSTRTVPVTTRAQRSSWGFALAASIMAASGLLFVQGTGQQLADGDTAADALLAQVLTHTPSGADGWVALSDGRQVKPVLSYARIGGSWCREYLLTDNKGDWHGVSCLKQGHWVTEVLSTSGTVPGSSSEYRTAGANDSNLVADFMGENAVGIALNAEREEELIATQWR